MKDTARHLFSEVIGIARNLLLTVVVVGVFTTLVLYLSGAPPLEAYYQIFIGSIGSWAKLDDIIQVWIPLTLCACGLLYTFRIDLWNIGVEGQIMTGAIMTTAVLRLGAGAVPAGPLVLLSLAAGVLGGALWALLAGFLKTRSGVNEIFAGLGLNFVAQGLILWLIFGPWKRPGVASMSGTEVFPTDLWLSTFESIRISGLGLFLVLAGIVITAMIVRYTRIGLNLKAIGRNPRAALLFGLRPGLNMLLAMGFAGGFAGLAGGIQVCGVYHRLIPSISSNYGYLALMVVMLSNYDIRVVPLVTFFFAALNVGSIQLPMVLQVDSSLSGVIQGALVLATLAVHGWRVRQRGQKEGRLPA
jgi:ABC-type uncharacterized transport system permease subunit